MKKIKLHRPKEHFNDNCSYKIILGQKTLAELKNGEEKIIEIPENLENKSLQAKIQWYGSEKMQLRNLNESESIMVSGNNFLNKTLPLSGAIIVLSGILIFSTNNIILKNIGIGILILVFIGLIGTFTIGKNKFLKLNKNQARNQYLNQDHLSSI